MLKRIAGRLAPQVALPRASVAPLSKKFVHSQDAEETPLKTLQQTPSSFHGKGLEDGSRPLAFSFFLPFLLFLRFLLP